MEFRARFAPSPTGQVHIGNIRTAIFNWLCTRHAGGQFLLRIEDTDLERSTREAIDTLLECMKWLGLDYDGEAMYQTAESGTHRKAAEDLMKKGFAYKLDPAQEASPVYFRMPYNCDSYPFVRQCGTVEIELDKAAELSISRAGLVYFTINAKGKSVENAACLAGFKDLEVTGQSGELMFKLDSEGLAKCMDAVEPLKFAGAAKLRFVRREVFFSDMVKGELAKPLDSIKDFIIIRSDSSPVFHLANVCDDITQKVTHIVRGDDHVENTYRHLFLFEALGYPPPVYAHLPMIVNASGKPYSKRDGDAFVGDFKEKGFLPEALFNYLSLLGWSPGDNREKMTKQELVEAFNIEKAQRSPAQFDIAKLSNMNGLYLAEMSLEKFSGMVWDYAARWDWRKSVDRALFDKVAALMHSRTKTFADAAAWKSFFTSDFEYDQKAFKKFLADQNTRTALEKVAAALEKAGAVNESGIEKIIRDAETVCSIQQGKLNQPLRVAVTGITVGAGVYETLALLGSGESAARIRRTLAMPVPQ